MAGRGSKNGQRTRVEAERARLHAARIEWHGGQARRRVRDNTIAGIAGGLLLVAVIASQVVHAQVTAPEPTPTPTSIPTPSDAPAPTDAPTPTDAPEPTPSETPAP